MISYLILYLGERGNLFVSIFVSGDVEILTYFYAPIGALLVINMVLFAATARELTCGLWKRELVKSTTER